MKHNSHCVAEQGFIVVIVELADALEKVFFVALCLLTAVAESSWPFVLRVFVGKWH